MIENHPSVDIETFASKIKNSLQRNAEVEELQSVSEIGDMSSFSKADRMVQAMRWSSIRYLNTTS